MNAIADGGANEILFPLQYDGLSHVSLTPSKAIMADGASTLQLHGTAQYGVFHVMLADVLRPIWSETKLTLPPHNLHIFKSGMMMRVYNPDTLVVVMSATVDMNDGLYHIDDITSLLKYRISSAATVCTPISPIVADSD
jgi:hypothetical protein